MCPAQTSFQLFFLQTLSLNYPIESFRVSLLPCICNSGICGIYVVFKLHYCNTLPISPADPKTHPAPDLGSRNRTEPPSPPWHLSSESLDPSMLTWSQSHLGSQTQARQSPPHPTSPARAARAQTKPWHADACPEPSQQEPQTPQATSMSR